MLPAPQFQFYHSQGCSAQSEAQLEDKDEGVEGMGRERVTRHIF